MSSNTDNIINATEFKPSDVKYSKPKLNKAGGKAVGILNFKTNKSLYLRTPLMMTWGVNKFEDKATGKVTYDMALQFPRDDYRSEETDKFLAAMVAFQDQVKADVLANSKEWLNKAKMTAEVVDNLFHPMLKYPKDLSTGEFDLTKSPSLKLKLSYWDNKFDCEIYDLASTMLFPNEATPAITPLELIPKLSNVAVIIQCGGVWLANGKCGVTWKLFQAAVKPKPSMKGKCFLSFAGDMEGIQAILDAKDKDGKAIPMTSANNGQDTSTYDPFQKEQLAVMAEAKYITQFLDRDTRPDFAGPVVGPAIQSWFKNPKDVNKIVDSLQAQWDALPPLA